MRGPLHPPLLFVLTQTLLASFLTLCTIRVDLSAARKDVVLREPFGQFIYKLEYDVVVFFGFTELRAQLQWKTRVSNASAFLALS